MLAWCAIAAAVGGLGLACVRTAPPFARWCAAVVLLGFLVVSAAADESERASIPADVQRVAADGDALVSRAALLAAAARAGPRAVELELRWRGPFATSGAAPTRALGAQAVAPDALPFAPGDVRVRVPSELAVGRPALLEVAVDGLRQPVSARLRVVAAGGEELQQVVTLGEGATSVELLPATEGRRELTLQIDVGDSTITCAGALDVGPPDEVLVIEPADVAAAALRAQGVRVRAARALPQDWAEHRTIVLDELLPRDQQQQLVAAVLDGVGVFATARAFAAAESPLRAILPLRVLPRQPDEGEGDGDGDGGSGDGARDADPTPRDPPADPSPEPPPDPPGDDEPIGSTEDSKPVSPEPIDVDKHAIAMVLVVDRSYSMGARLANGKTKMSYAKTSALRTANALGKGDRVGVVTFGDKGFGRVELAMHDASDEREVRSGIEKLAHSREDTYLLSGLRAARDLLERERAAVKHVVVVTDGEYRVSEQMALRAEANRMRIESKATLSMISITDEATDPQFLQFAEVLTHDGGGRFLPIRDPEVVPVLVSAEVTRALSRVGRKPRVEGGDPDVTAPPPDAPPPEQPEPPSPEPPTPEPPQRLPVFAVAESSLLAPDPDEWPTLARAVATEAPLEARVLLVCSEQGWPLLAYANRGLGRVGAFGADLLGDAGREFRARAAFPAWLAQWVAATTPAQAVAEARALDLVGGITPLAPVPADVRWLAAVAGAPPKAAAGEVPATVGYRARSRVAAWAPLLLGALLLLALAERALQAARLRRGQA